MGWFDEQLRTRKRADDAVFEESFRRMAGAVMGRRMSEALNDDRQIAEDAIGEILKYYRVKPQEVPETIRDMNEVLEFLLRPYGIMRRGVRLDPGWHRDAMGAMLGRRTDDGSVVALLPRGLSGYAFFDRKSGRMVRLDRQTEKLIDPEAIAFYKPFPLTKMTMGSLMGYILQQIAPADLALLALSLLAVTGVGMLTPWLTERLFSDVLLSGSYRVLLAAAIFLCCATVSGIAFKSIQALLTARIGTKLNLSVAFAPFSRFNNIVTLEL